MNTDLKRPNDPRDRGSTLVLVLVMMVIGSLVVLPVMSYTISVFRAQNVQIDKARSMELARGGTWVALANETALYDLCDGGALPSSLSGVSTTCQILETATLRQPSEVPYSVAVVQADTGGSVPAAIPPAMMAVLSAEQAYVNPNTRPAWDVWTTNPDHSPLSTAGKVWLPQLPVQPTSAGGTRDTDMQPGTQDPAYSSCRVFFPGTFTSAIDIAEPAYFTSGVYYFTQPITLRRGADVVVGGGGSNLGCTTDFEAISSAVSVPDPLNMSGVGGTFVFGGNARLEFNDSSGAGNIRFAMNQRYVSNDEASVSASSNVSIVSVNGNHAPFVATNPADVLGADLRVDGVIAVPASTTDDPADDPDDPAGDPLAHTTGYAPSELTPKPTAPDAPTNVVITSFRVPSEPFSTRGRLRVTWTTPNANGSLITGYVATASTGQTCSPPAPTLPDTSVQPSCTITNLSSGSRTVSVVAQNAVGTSLPSAPSASVNVVTNSGGTALAVPSVPTAVSVGASYSDGLTVSFSPPTSNGGTPVTTYNVTATHSVSGAVVSCPPVWWDETSCVLPITDAPAVDDSYVIRVLATNSTGDSAIVTIDGIPTDGTTAPEPDPYLYVAGAEPAPVQVAAVAGVRTPTPIIDLTLVSSAIADITILGYIAVPQGHVRINATNPANKTVQLNGGVVAANLRLDAAPATLVAVFDNPVAQKRVRLRSLATSGGYTAMSEAVVQVNRSGSLAINSWISQ